MDENGSLRDDSYLLIFRAAGRFPLKYFRKGVGQAEMVTWFSPEKSHSSPSLAGKQYYKNTLYPGISIIY